MLLLLLPPFPKLSEALKEEEQELQRGKRTTGWKTSSSAIPIAHISSAVIAIALA
jgi:hypothetical protein